MKKSSSNFNFNVNSSNFYFNVKKNSRKGVGASLLKWNLFKLSFSIIITKSTLNTLPHQNSNHLYSKITLLLNGRELKVKKKKARLVKKMIDFPQEFRFKLNGENVMDCELRVQIKKSSLLPMQRSK